MIMRSLMLLLTTSCVSGNGDVGHQDVVDEPAVSRAANYRTADDETESLAAMMARLAAASCPVPCAFLPPDGIMPPECYGAIVAVAEGVVAVKMDDPSDWPPDVHHLSVMVDRGDVPGFGGNAIVVGRIGTTMICRFFSDPACSGGPARVGDSVSADFARTRLRDGASKFRARWSTNASKPQDGDGSVER